MLKVTFQGVRGSCPTADAATRRYGGNTSCVLVEVPNELPLVLDLGTGVCRFGKSQPLDGTFRGAALLSHVHWDHVQGLPFFVPIDRAGAVLDVYGPPEGNRSLAEVFDGIMRPPYFPVRVSELRGHVRFHEVLNEDMAIGAVKVMVRPVPHCGVTLGFRLEAGETTLAYLSDHQAPRGMNSIAAEVLELCGGVDLLIHDAQYTTEEFDEKSHWGHCTVDYAVFVAREVGARRLALFHHDPSHSDDMVDDLLRRARFLAAAGGIEEVLAASEGMVVNMDDDRGTTVVLPDDEGRLPGPKAGAAMAEGMPALPDGWSGDD